MKNLSTSDRLKQIMAERNLKQIDIINLAKPYAEKYRTKIERNDISQYVAGKVEPRQPKLFILSKALNVNEAWLMGYDVDPSPSESTLQEESPFDSDFIRKNSSFYRTLLSAEGLKLVRKQLASRIDSYGFDKFQAELGVDFRSLKTFLSADITIGTECQAQLEKMLVILETDLYELFKENFVNDEIKSYYDLDDIDRAEVRGEIKNMLKSDKYKKHDRIAFPKSEDPTRSYTNIDFEDHKERIAAYGLVKDDDDIVF